MNMRPAVITFLKAVPCFTDLSPVELARIAANCQPKSLSKGQLLSWRENRVGVSTSSNRGQ